MTEWQKQVTKLLVTLNSKVHQNGRAIRKMEAPGGDRAIDLQASGVKASIPCFRRSQLRVLDNDLAADPAMMWELVSRKNCKHSELKNFIKSSVS